MQVSSRRPSLLLRVVKLLARLQQRQQLPEIRRNGKRIGVPLYHTVLFGVEVVEEEVEEVEEAPCPPAAPPLQPVGAHLSHLH